MIGKRRSHETEFLYPNGTTAMNTGSYYPQTESWTYWSDGSESLSIDAGYGKATTEANQAGASGTRFEDGRGSRFSYSTFGSEAYAWSEIRSDESYRYLVVRNGHSSGAATVRETKKGTVPTALKKRILEAGLESKSEYLALDEAERWKAGCWGGCVQAILRTRKGTISRTDSSLTVSYTDDDWETRTDLVFDKDDFEDHEIPTRLIAILQGAGGGGGGTSGGGGGSGASWIGAINLDFNKWEFLLSPGGTGATGDLPAFSGAESYIEAAAEKKPGEKTVLAKATAPGGRGGDFTSPTHREGSCGLGAERAASKTETLPISGKPYIWPLSEKEGLRGGMGGWEALGTEGWLGGPGSDSPISTAPLTADSQMLEKPRNSLYFRKFAGGWLGGIATPLLPEADESVKKRSGGGGAASALSKGGSGGDGDVDSPAYLRTGKDGEFGSGGGGAGALGRDGSEASGGNGGGACLWLMY